MSVLSKVSLLSLAATGLFLYTGNTIKVQANTEKTNTTIVGQYYAGNKVIYTETVQANGYTWLKYISASGAIRYVAIVH